MDMITEVERHEEYGTFRKTGTNGHQNSHTNYYVGERTVVKCRVTKDSHKVYEINPKTGHGQVVYEGNAEGAIDYLRSRFGIGD